MLIRRIDGATCIFDAPADWKNNEELRSVLAIRDVQTEQGNFMVSAWKPDPHELAALKAGSHIELWIRGTTHPVVALEVPKPKTYLIRCIKYAASAGEAPACPSNCSCVQAASPAVAAAAARWEAFRKAVVEEDDIFLDLMMDALANEHKLTAEQWDAAIDAAIAVLSERHNHGEPKEAAL